MGMNFKKVREKVRENKKDGKKSEKIRKTGKSQGQGLGKYFAMIHNFFLRHYGKIIYIRCKHDEDKP